MPHVVVAWTGGDLGHTFYSDRHLNVNEGYKILPGALRVSPQEPEALLILTISRATGQRRGRNDGITTEESEEGNLTLLNKRAKDLMLSHGTVCMSFVLRPQISNVELILIHCYRRVISAGLTRR